MPAKPIADAFVPWPRSNHPPSYRDAMYVPTRGEAVGAGALLSKRYEPLTLRSWVVTVVVITLLGLAVGIEVSLALSNKKGGFVTPPQNVFTHVSPRFLTAFFPTLLVAGLLLIWQSSDRSYRELQPYIVLARGNVTAAEGLLANYSGLSVWSTIANSLKFRHYLILLSTITTLLGSLLQPLAGSVIQAEQLPSTTNGIFIQSTKTLGVVSDESTLAAFLAAAGFADAAVFHSLPDPPFIHGGWSIAEFAIPSAPVLNGTLSVNTTSIETAVNCEVPQTFNLTALGSGNFSIQATTSGGCGGNVTFDPDSTTSGTQYGVVALENCGSDDIEFQPVMFWFFHRKADDIQTPQAAGVFCNPTISALNVMATVDLNNNSIISVTTLSAVTSSNNVTGAPQNGRAFNSLKFPPSNDTFVTARATAIPSGVSGSIFRFASQPPHGLQQTFDDPNGFLRITEQVYTQHLSISAKSVYFVAAPSTVSASMTSLTPHLVIDALPAHALSVVLTFIGFSALFLHIVHSRQRRRFFLAASPGSIAHIISMTAHARFGEKLYPYDDDETLARKLAGLNFGLDPRTGAVVADRHLGPVAAPAGAVTPFTVTPYTEAELRPRPSITTVGESTFVPGYGRAFDEKRARIKDNSSAFSGGLSAFSGGSSTFGGGSSAFGEGSNTYGGGASAYDEGSSSHLGEGSSLLSSDQPEESQESQDMRQLPAYSSDLEAQNGRLFVPIDEKRGRVRDITSAGGNSSRSRSPESQSDVNENVPLIQG
ncbi:hypothetical protein C8F04DRAFT_1062401 [Mycena alexandri]|uniref:Uncharacterized protein n=1 Tax=Mycena alexandri TaxID=1745969 RepID=A0AAD6XJ50_9AGAR|nr:hypothetical protein C8F04DRAFT_1062401 [Mycena alexandri]